MWVYDKLGPFASLMVACSLTETVTRESSTLLPKCTPENLQPQFPASADPDLCWPTSTASDGTWALCCVLVNLEVRTAHRMQAFHMHGTCSSHPWVCRAVCGSMKTTDLMHRAAAEQCLGGGSQSGRRDKFDLQLGWAVLGQSDCSEGWMTQGLVCMWLECLVVKHF